MIKKFAMIMFLVATLIFIGGQNNQAEAREVYVGTYSDGTAVYLLTETVSRTSGYDGFNCTVRAGRDYLNYKFWWSDNDWRYSNSEGYSGRVSDGNSPVAASIMNHILSSRYHP